MRKHTTFNFDSEFLSTVSYYLPDREEMKKKIAQVLRFLANLEDGVISESDNCLLFKRNVLSLVAKYQRKAYFEYNEYGSPYTFDNNAISCGMKIEQLIDKELTWVEGF